MRNLLLILAVLISLASCESKPDIKGVWIGGSGNLIINDSTIVNHGDNGFDSAYYYFENDSLVGLIERKNNKRVDTLFAKWKIYKDSLVISGDTDYEGWQRALYGPKFVVTLLRGELVDSIPNRFTALLRKSYNNYDEVFFIVRNGKVFLHEEPFTNNRALNDKSDKSTVFFKRGDAVWLSGLSSYESLASMVPLNQEAFDISQSLNPNTEKKQYYFADMSDYTITNNNGGKILRNKKGTGFTIFWNENGRRTSQTFEIGNKRFGHEIIWDYNGSNIKELTFYWNGKRQGESIRIEESNVVVENYNNDLRDGYSTSWGESLLTQKLFRKGKNVGDTKYITTRGNMAIKKQNGSYRQGYRGKYRRPQEYYDDAFYEMFYAYPILDIELSGQTSAEKNEFMPKYSDNPELLKKYRSKHPKLYSNGGKRPAIFKDRIYSLQFIINYSGEKVSLFPGKAFLEY